MTVKDLVGLDLSKQETTSGRDEGDRASCEEQDRWGRDQGPASLSFCLSATLFDLSCSGLFSHYVGPNDSQPVRLSHYVHRCLLSTAF